MISPIDDSCVKIFVFRKSSGSWRRWNELCTHRVTIGKVQGDFHEENTAICGHGSIKANIDREADEYRPGIGAVGAKNADFGEYVRPGLGGGLGVVLSSFRGGAAVVLKYKHGSINIPLHLRAFANDLGR